MQRIAPDEPAIPPDFPHLVQQSGGEPLAHRDAAGAGSALLGGGQYAVGGLAGPVVSLAGNTAAAMSIAMGISAAAALASYRVLRVGTPHQDEASTDPEPGVRAGRRR